MKRDALQQMLSWKKDPERKPLILKGARQVGKTWLMKEFGTIAYESYVYFNFDEDPSLHSIFQTNKNEKMLLPGEPAPHEMVNKVLQVEKNDTR